MADNDTFYRQKFTHIQEIPPADDLIGGWYTASPITLNAEGELQRGTLLMTTDGETFTPASEAGVASAQELAILCADVDTENNPITTTAYFSGTLSGLRVILPYETEEDNHEELVEALRVKFRRQGFLLV